MAMKSFAVTVGAGDTDIFEMPAGLSGAVVLLIGNINASARTYTLKHYKSGTAETTTLASGVTVAPNTVGKFPVALTLEAGDKIIMSASATGSIVASGAATSRGAAIGTAWTPRGIYAAGTTYAKNDFIDGGDEQSYLSLQDANIGNTPSSSPSFWMAINLRNSLPSQLFALAAIADTANLVAIANLVGAANKAILFTGPGAVSLIDVSAHGQAMAAAADPPATKTILSLNNVDNTSDADKPVSTATQAALDSLALNLGRRQRVRAATTGNIAIATALNNGDTLDGITLATGDLVLVKDQTAPAENGVYVVGAAPARFAEFDTYNEHPGAMISVAEGTANSDTLWLCTSNAGGTLNTTAIAFSRLIIAGELLQSNALSELTPVASTARDNIGAAAKTDVQVFAANGTWTKLAGAKSVHVICVGPGGGGASGRKGAAASNRSGGGAGGGGAVTTRTFNADDLGATESVVVPAGGAGGGVQTVDNTSGSQGSNGAIASFGSWLKAGGGGAGAAGSNVNRLGGGGGGAISSGSTGNAGAPQPDGNAIGGHGGLPGPTSEVGTDGYPAEWGGGGGASSSIDPASTMNGGGSVYGGGGGGAGGGIDNADVLIAAGAGGGVQVYASGGGGAAGGTGAAGSAGAANATNKKGYGGAGGGGGGASKTVGVAAGAGGAGGIPGGGGGGGGASVNGASTNSGAGGAGGRAEVTVITYF